jgi:SNF2 family DNA or RNA helicase
MSTGSNRERLSEELAKDRRAGPCLLKDVEWDVSYSHEDGDLVRLFYVPLLKCAKLYQRATGYFSAGSFALAARGLDALMARKGRMELLVGCTLNQDEIDEIKKGYDLREWAALRLGDRLATPEPQTTEQLGYLAHMIAYGFLDVKLAIPLDEHGEMRAGLGLYHAKAGIVTDEAGERLVFRGSINETEAAWRFNCESFEVSCSWRGDWEQKHVEKGCAEFVKLWTGKAKSARVFEFPDALKQRLLEFLPKTDATVAPVTLEEQEETPEPPPEPAADLDERRNKIWAFISTAAKRPDGAAFTVASSTMEPWPHQLRAFKRMLDNWPFRLLIADEVGLGKTIEAGLIIRHAWISGLAKRILIMTPKGVLLQWQSELYEKFNLLVPIYTGNSLLWPEHHCRQGPLEEPVARSEWTKAPLVLASSHLMRRQERQGDLLQSEDWDLLVLDEAHHARRKSAGTKQEKGPNRLLKLMHDIVDKAKSLLLMTATPMQVHPVEIWDLLKLLGLPPEWTDKAFVDYFETLNKNPDEQQLHRLAQLFQATEKTLGPVPEGEVGHVAEQLKLSGIDRQKTLAALREPSSKIPLKRLSVTQRKAALALLKVGSPVRYRMSRHTRNLLRQYFKKGLLASPIAERKPDLIFVPLSPAERQLYTAVEDYISEVYQSASPDKKTAVGFVMTIYRRRLASSFHALRHTLQDRLARMVERESRGAVVAAATDGTAALDEDLPQDEQADEQVGDDEAAAMAAAALSVEERGRIQELLKGIAKLGTDSKARMLVERLKQVFAEGYDSALVFTQYTDTMDFLKEYLGEQLDMPIGCYSGRGGEKRDASGAWTRCSKEHVKRLLREGQIKLLVCTDAAGEGLNLQTCGVLANYDLPWNPMKVEQRIGRIDRIGQKNAVIRVLNFAYEDTVEADVYAALNQRIGIFVGVVGKLQPILSRVPRAFETAVLGDAKDRERRRHEVVRNVNQLVSDAEGAAFDIDEVSDADLQPPAFPVSPVRPEDMDAILRRPELLPPGAECQELEPCTYALRLPGAAESARVTTSPRIFDDHFESHQLLLPDSPLFRKLVSISGSAGSDTPAGTLKDLL